MYNTNVCTTEFGNTGLQKYCGPKGLLAGYLLVPKGTEIATKVLALTLATWKDNINEAKASRWFPTPKVVNATPTQEEAVYQQFDFGFFQFVRDGKKTEVAILEQFGTYNKNQINKLNASSWDVYKFYDTDKISGWTDDGIKFLPYTTDYLRFLPETDSSGSVSENVSIGVAYTDVRQHNEFEVVLEPLKDADAPAAFYPTLEFKGIKDLIVTAADVTTTSATITLKGIDGIAYSGADGVPADVLFALAASPSTYISLTSFVETAVAGVYDAVWALQSADSYVIGLKPQPDATTQGFETPNLAAITIS